MSGLFSEGGDRSRAAFEAAVRADPESYRLWTWRPHRRQRELLREYYGHPEWKLFRGRIGKRFGKTKGLLGYIGARAACGFDPTLPPTRPLNVVVSGLTHEQLNQALRPELLGFLPAGSYRGGKGLETEVRVNGVHTGTLHWRSASAGPDAIQGINAHLILDDEEPGDDDRLWTEQLNRIIVAGGGGRLATIFTPVKGVTWSKEAILDLSSAWASPVFSGTTYDNAKSVYVIDGKEYGGDGYLDDELIGMMEDECGGRGTREWRIQMMGELISRFGLVWPDVGDSTHGINDGDCPGVEHADAVLIGADFGLTAPTASLVGILKFHDPKPEDPARLYLIDLYYETGNLEDQFVALLNQLAEWQPDNAVIDPTPTMANPTTTEPLIDQLNSRGAWFEAAQKDERIGLLNANTWLYKRCSDGRPRVLVARGGCAHVFPALARYHWKPDNRSWTSEASRAMDQRPRRGGDHIPHALRYLLMEAERVVKLESDWSRRVVAGKTSNPWPKMGSEPYLDRLAREAAEAMENSGRWRSAMPGYE